MLTEARQLIGEKIPEIMAQFFLKFVIALALFVVGLYIIGFIRKLVKNSLSRTSLDRGVIQFTDGFIKIGLFVILVMMLAAQFGIQTTSFMALLGSAGVAIGLALQGSMSNVVGGLLLLIVRPFVVGDFIAEGGGGLEGTVTEISLFYTKLETPDGKVIFLPNGDLTNRSITNYTATKERRVDIIVGVSYMADLSQVKKVLTEMLEDEPLCDKEKPAEVTVWELADSSVNILVRCWCHNNDYWQLRYSLNERIKLTLDGAGIEIPYRQLTVHTQQYSQQNL